MQLDEVIGRDGRHVEALGVDVDGRGSRQQLEDPDGAGGSGPGIAEDGLVVAVDKSSVGRVRLESKSSSRLVESLFNSTAVA